VVAVLAWCVAWPAAQSVTAAIANGAMRVRAPGFHFIAGAPLKRLKDGQSVPVDLELSVLAKPSAAAAAQRRVTFVLSYDLWEERFAVALRGVPARSMSHLTVAAAEAWCLEQLAVPASALGWLGKDTPYWIRIEARMLEGDAADERDEGYTLRGLIDVLSRRQTGAVSHSVEAGPFRTER
jgi:hypothetical protein